ncbi:MAG: pentapeptide repeat-containing protein [Pseudonocardiales bacterium]
MADEKPPEGLAAANDKVRGAAKWLLGATAAVGAALIGGSQLSSIGKLEACTGSSQQCLRLPIAALSSVIALVALAYIIWTAVGILLPVAVTVADLDQAWDAGKRADVKFLKANTPLLGYARPSDLETARTQAWNDLVAARKALKDADADDPTRAAKTTAHDLAESAFKDKQQRVATVTDIAQYELLQSDFRSLMARLLPATAVVALGIVTFAWAANPPAAETPSAKLAGANLTNADLSGADLSGADLTRANFSNADLSGASLSHAKLRGAVWKHTTCPDGTDSDDHSKTCLGHLSP